MKKLTAAILALLICVFAFASCGSDNNKPSDTTPKTSDVGSKQEETRQRKITETKPLRPNRRVSGPTAIDFRLQTAHRAVCNL